MKNLIALVLVVISLYGCEEENGRPVQREAHSQSGQVINTNSHMSAQSQESFSHNHIERAIPSSYAYHEGKHEKYMPPAMSAMALELNRMLKKAGGKLVRGKYHFSTKGGEYVVDTFTASRVMEMMQSSRYSTFDSGNAKKYHR